MTWSRALLAFGLISAPWGCGNSTRQEPRQGASGSAGQATAGPGGSAAGSSGGAPVGSLSAGTSTTGGTGAEATGGNALGGGATAGMDTGGGAAGEGGEASTAPINADFSWALWPMPNTLDSGLPHPLSYDTSVDGIVTDNITGLIWQAEPAPFTVQLKDAANVCKALNLGGNGDWRLPSRLELVSLMALERESGVDSTAFPATPPTTPYWSSSRVADQDITFWVVAGIAVFQASESVEEAFSVRCVRSVPRPLPATPHYVVQADVVRDTWTGLWWERNTPALWREFDLAAAYCDDLTLGGYSDWYFPSIKEMLTIVDEHRTSPALDTYAFPGPNEVTSGWTWSSSRFPIAGDEPRWALATRFGDGLTWHERLPGGWLSRCARQDP